MIKVSHKQSGFTLVELLVAFTIASIVVVMVGMTFTQGSKYTRKTQAEAKLVSAAAHLTDVMTYSIRPGSDVQAVTTSEIEITNPDLTLTTIEFDGTDILLDGTAILPDDITPTALTFTLVDKTVRISYQLTIDTGTSPYTPLPFNGTTTVALRN